ncbi:MAG: zinc ribbon domain-containing protein [Gemmatimonadaceae bacterium]|nr:zinc ribbon domain-containing protein [Gemmatimonadaceae bacterium]
MSKSSLPIACPSCGATSAGKFCAECGSALLGVTCASCQSLLTPGSRFCHRCGAAAGAAVRPTPRGAPAGTTLQQRSILPWAVGTVAVLALVITVAVQQSSATNPPASGPDIPLDAAGAAPFAGNAAGGAIRAPDISSMPLREQADRLYNRVMRLASEGKTDSAAFFSTMAAQAYELLEPLDNDLRYDYGRMAAMSGNLDLARKQSESILASNPDHLLGIVLGASVAQAKNDTGALATLYKKLLAVEQTERAKNVEEYERHKGDIDAALIAAKSEK